MSVDADRSAGFDDHPCTNTDANLYLVAYAAMLSELPDFSEVVV